PPPDPPLPSLPTRRSSDLARPTAGYSVLPGPAQRRQAASDGLLEVLQPLDHVVLVEVLGVVEGQLLERLGGLLEAAVELRPPFLDRKSTRLNSSHEWISYA